MSQTQTTADETEPEAVNEIENRLDEVEQEVEERIEDVEQEVEERIEEVEERVEEAQERVEEATEDVRENLEEAVEDTLETVNDNVVDVGSQVLDTQARADVYVALRSLDGGDAEAVAEQTGLYPDKVEEVLDALEDDGVVEEADGEYEAVAPTDLVRVVSDRLTDTFNDFVESGQDAIDENRQRIRDSLRLGNGDAEEGEATEIPIES